MDTMIVSFKAEVKASAFLFGKKALDNHISVCYINTTLVVVRQT